MGCGKPGLLSSLSPRVCANSCPLSQWCHRAILSSVTSFSSCPQSFPASFSYKSAIGIRGPKYWSFSFSIGPSNEYSGLISFGIDWFDFLSFQGTLISFHLQGTFALLLSSFFILCGTSSKLLYRYISPCHSFACSLLVSSQTHHSPEGSANLAFECFPSLFSSSHFSCSFCFRPLNLLSGPPKRPNHYHCLGSFSLSGSSA